MSHVVEFSKTTGGENGDDAVSFESKSPFILPSLQWQDHYLDRRTAVAKSERGEDPDARIA